jgi:hypothetical protein
VASFGTVNLPEANIHRRDAAGPKITIAARSPSEGAGGSKQIVDEHDTEEGGHGADDVDDFVCRAEISLFNLHPGGLVAPDRENRHQDTDDHEADAEGERDPGLARLEILETKKLTKGDAKFGDDETKDDHADAGAHPGEESAFVGQMIAGALWRLFHGD